ncbi:MAG: prenyltransferase/squalene oxidase repeat-containing protein [Pseudomonadota bacterium]
MVGETKTDARALPRPINALYVFIGGAAVVLSNVSAIFTHVDEIREFVTKYLGLSGFFRAHELAVATTTVGAMIGFGLLVYWLFQSFVRQRRRRDVVAFLVVAALGFPVVGFLGFQTIKPISVPKLMRTEAADLTALAYSQQEMAEPNAGGIRFSQSGTAADVQPWTTAQVLYGILNAQPDVQKQSAEIRAALEYIERTRHPVTGWGYMAGSAKGVTEINAWMILANLASLRVDTNHRIWRTDETPIVVAWLERDIAELAARQHEDGGWAPIGGTANPRHVRTYSTLMAVWALVEARNNSLISGQRSWKYDQNIKNGVRWLLKNRQTSRAGVSGWWPNPHTTNQNGSFVGLTAHVLYVLQLAKAEFPFLVASDDLTNARMDFLKTTLDGGGGRKALADRPVEQNDRPHDADRYLQGVDDFQAESSTFLWYPWSLAAAVAMMDDPTLSEQERKAAKRLVRILIRRSGDLAKFVQADEAVYPTAESLFAIGLYLRSEQAKPS